MKIWPIAVASLIFGWAMLQNRRYPVRELCGALRDDALRAHGAIGWEHFAAWGLEADTVWSWDYNW